MGQAKYAVADDYDADVVRLEMQLRMREFNEHSGEVGPEELPSR
jgi:hypothetical protein